ncbi:hypothetical protein E3U43_020493 [Larimichthys crocea]|uniref:Uncharacterized protein n=1 Tax=Larimichthys crocea TaxID=215358 RepID=A0ACD3Q7K1_LARCR|nr:hypothetical protein E3U43_020493 [Larimichthys crocea]
MSITQNLVSRLAFQPLNLKDCTRIRGTECPFVSELGRRRTKPGNCLEYGGQGKKANFRLDGREDSYCHCVASAMTNSLSLPVLRCVDKTSTTDLDLETSTSYFLVLPLNNNKSWVNFFQSNTQFTPAVVSSANEANKHIMSPSRVLPDILKRSLYPPPGSSDS